MSQENYIFVALRAALGAGKEILKIYNDPDADFSVEKKADNSPLTIADKISHQVITSYLVLTNIPVLSEEGKSIPYDERSMWKLFWLVDPIDGTKEFIGRNGEFTVNIALIENGHPILGIVYVPVTGVLYLGSENGSYKYQTDRSFDVEHLFNTEEKLPLSRKRSTYRVVGSRSHMSPETVQYIKSLDTKGKGIEIISKGSSLKICLVAEGEADIYPRLGPTMEWDTAAGHAVARFAGKNIVEYPSGIQLKYNKRNLINPWFIVS